MLSNMDFQNHTNSRPKFQPIRVKELLHFCESDDDESEDKPQDSDTNSDSDDLQPLAPDSYSENDLNKSLPLHTEEYDSNLKTDEVLYPDISSKPEESTLIDAMVESKIESECSHKFEHNIESKENVKYKQLNQVQLGIENIQEKVSQHELENKYIDNVNIKDQQSSCKNTDIKMEMLASKATINEEKVYCENVCSIDKSLTLDTVSSVDQWTLQTPLKHIPSSSTRPDPCLSRRNITQTPQNKSCMYIPSTPNNQELTPVVISKQTPLQNKSVNLKDSIQTLKASIHFTPSIVKRDVSRYLSSETKVRKPLADTSGSIQNDVPSKDLLQKSQLLKINEITPKMQDKLSNKFSNERPNVVKQTCQTTESVIHLESDANQEFLHLNVENVTVKETVTQHKLSNNGYTHCSKGSKENLAPLCNDFQNQHLMPNNQNQQQEFKEVINNASNIQFSIPFNTSKSKEGSTLFVKGKEYLILGVLGHGMSGEVLRAQDLSSLELCAIKCVNLTRMDKDSAQGCLEEISMLHKLQAPCIVKMFDYEIKYPMVYVVMEMGDTDLSRLIKSMLQEKQIPLTMILYYWTEMLTAVKHIHDNGVIHSDLKPANFLLVRGRLKLIDFGIASSMNSDMTSVVKNCPIGTLNYISPEALMDIGGNSDSPTQNVKYKINFKSDVWSLGCILYSLVYGHTPFQHIRSQWAKVNAITNPKPNIPFPSTLPSREGNKPIPSPPILIDVMRKCLQHDPKARPTVAELLQIEYVPTKQEHMLTTIPKIPANILVKIKHTLNEDEWRQLIWILENKQYT